MKTAFTVALLGLISVWFYYLPRNEEAQTTFVCDWMDLELFHACLQQHYLERPFGELQSVLIADGFEFIERQSESDHHYFRKRANNLANYVAVALVWVNNDGDIFRIETP